MTQFDPKGVQSVNLSDFLDSLHMVSYHLPIHIMALNATDNEIIGGYNQFKLLDYYLV